MMNKRKLIGLGLRLGAGLGLGLTLALTGCGSAPPPPATLSLAITGGATQNPTPGGSPAPVAVRLYQLAAAGKFQSTDVYTLMSQETTALGTEEVTPSEQLLVAPGQKLAVVRTLKPGVQFLGVAVLFRDIGHARWQQMIPVPASGPVKATLIISGTTATLTAAK